MQFNRERNLNKLVERTRWRHHPFLSSRVHLCSMSLSVHPSPVWPSSLLDHDVPPPRRLARLIEIETSAPFQRTFIARRAIIRFSVSSPPASTPSSSLSLSLSLFFSLSLGFPGAGTRRHRRRLVVHPPTHAIKLAIRTGGSLWIFSWRTATPRRCDSIELKTR